MGFACNTGLPGVCAAGTTVCSGGGIACSQNQSASSEVCDSLDNDCNGVVDNGAVGSIDLGSTFPTTVTGTTSGSPNQFSGTCGGNLSAEKSYTWTAPSDGTYVFDTIGSSYDSVLYLRNGTCAGSEIACNDDAVGVDSQITLAMTTGQKVIIFVDGYNGQGGNYNLHITCSGSDAFSNSCGGAASMSVATGAAVDMVGVVDVNGDDYLTFTFGAAPAAGSYYHPKVDLVNDAGGAYVMDVLSGCNSAICNGITTWEMSYPSNPND